MQADFTCRLLGLIKGIHTKGVNRWYGPDNVNFYEGKLKRLTSTEIRLDYALRNKDNVSDPLILTSALTTSLIWLLSSEKSDDTT